jgi:hypothetical protein
MVAYDSRIRSDRRRWRVSEYLSAYLSVLRVCSQLDWAGLTHAIMQVLDLSPVWGGGREG